MLALATINPLQAAGLTQVFPGGSVQLQAPGYECVEENFYAGSPGGDEGELNLASCSAGAAGGEWQSRIVLHTALLERAYERAAATGKVVARFKIAENVNPSTSESNIAATTISAEMAYSGTLLFGLPFLGVEPAFASIVMTLQVRDMETDTVIASNTFLNESVDIDFVAELDNGFNRYIKGSTAADVFAQLKRGREYQVEVEAVCASEVVEFALGTVDCQFDVGNRNDGMFVSPITVSVADDNLGKILSRFDTIEQSITTILNNLSDLNLKVSVIDQKVNVLSQDLDQHDVKITNLLTILQESADANHDALLEIIRLLHTPTGRRTSEFPACNDGPCDFAEKP
jgi:hypothetical protein